VQEGHGCHLLDCTHVVMCACESLTFEGGITALTDCWGLA